MTIKVNKPAIKPAPRMVLMVPKKILQLTGMELRFVYSVAMKDAESERERQRERFICPRALRN